MQNPEEHVPVLDPLSGVSSEVVEKRLDTLPNEIATIILEFVALPRRNYPGHPVKGCLGTKDLLSVMVCSHHFQSVGESGMYGSAFEFSFGAELLKHFLGAGFPHSTWTLGAGLLSPQDTSQSLSMLTQQSVLYRNVTQRSHKELPNLIRTLCSRPELAQYIRYVELNEVHGTKDLNSNLSPSHLSFIRSHLPIEVDTETFKSSQWSALATYVLSLCHNIEELKLTSWWDNTAQQLGFLEDAFGAEYHRLEASPSPPFLPKLRHVELCVGNRKYSPSIGTLLRIMQHKGLETFIADNIVDMGYTFVSRLGQPVIMLRSLKFERSNISMTALEGILACCPVLEELVYDREQSSRDLRPRQPFLPGQLLPIIKHLSPCLRELVVYRPELTNMQRDLGAESAAELTTIGSLVEFESLTSLAITAHLLLRLQDYPNSYWVGRYNEVPQPEEKMLKLSKCLPKSLEYLKLMNCGKNMAKYVLELIEKSGVVTPNLKSIVLEFQDLSFDPYFEGFTSKVWRRQATHTWLDHRELAGLEEECSSKGIILDIWYN